MLDHPGFIPGPKSAQMDRLKIFLSNRTNVILVLVLLVVLLGSLFAASKIFFKKGPEVIQDVEMTFDPDGPYALLVPRRDGNAINLILKRVASYDSFAYQIAYSDETGIDRGAGDPNTWINIDKKDGDFEQEILFGTCSKGNTSDPLHCVFDKGVENGTLVVRIRKGNVAYKTNITWHMQKPDVALGLLTSGDGHFTYKVETEDNKKLSLIAFSIINDLTGVPKLPDGKEVLGRVYALNIPIAKVLDKGEISFELLDNPTSDAKIYKYTDSKNSWNELDTKTDGNKLNSQTDGAGIFAVVINSSK